jgi:hypothetical protein
MKQTVAVIMLLIALFQSGCASTVTRETLMRRATRHSLTLYPDTTYYCGSRRGFDYFFIQPAGPTTFRRAHCLRVRESVDPMSDRFEFTRQRNRWRVLVGLDLKPQKPQPNQPADPTPAAGTPVAEQTSHQP